MLATVLLLTKNITEQYMKIAIDMRKKKNFFSVIRT